MSARPQYNQPTAFSTTSSPRRLPVQTGTGAERGRETSRGGVASPGPAPYFRPDPPPARSRGENWKLLLMICFAALCAVAGFAYLSSYVMMTNEAYRHTKLSNQILQETQKTQHLKHQHAVVNTPDNIEQHAKDMHMVRPNEQLTITVGK